jgi:hypothetical protein
MDAAGMTVGFAGFVMVVAVLFIVEQHYRRERRRRILSHLRHYESWALATASLLASERRNVGIVGFVCREAAAPPVVPLSNRRPQFLFA